MTDLLVRWGWGISRNEGILVMRGMILTWGGGGEVDTPLRTMVVN